MISRKFNLGCVEFAVPGSTLEEKLGLLELNGMWLELVNDGLDEKKLKNILEVLPSFKTKIISVQAYLLHDLKILSADSKDRKLALHHIEETLKTASDVGAKNVVTVACYGSPEIANPVEECTRIFRNLGRIGAEFDITISVEALSKQKTKFLPGVPEIYELVKAVNSDYVKLMADTMHIQSNGENAAEVVKKYSEEIRELHLRDTGSKPPGKGKIDFSALKNSVENFSGLLCLEYKQEENKTREEQNKEFRGTINFIFEALQSL